ncbi:CHAP domain-containing protein [Streptococcus pluranimalium]|uniref:CHAP domain-containing protein n=1 Tax=Streptococcus pluranimalium TaxID=82348 RepID=UPI003F68C44F
MATVTEALNTVRALTGHRVGNGQCYGLVAYYEHLISPNSTVGLGAGVNNLSGVVGDTLRASNIGSGYNWSANNWQVLTNVSASSLQVGQIINYKAFYGAPVFTGEYGHTAIVAGINGSTVTIAEQNYAGKEWVVYNTYTINSAFIGSISSLITPPGIATTSNQATASKRQYAEKGTMTVTVDAINVRRAPNTTGQVVATYKKGSSFVYDTVIVDQNGFVWVSYVGGSGKRNYVATGATKDGVRFGSAWGTFK